VPEINKKSQNLSKGKRDGKVEEKLVQDAKRREMSRKMRLYERTSDASPTDNEEWDQSRSRSKSKSSACLQKRFDRDFKEACDSLGLHLSSRVNIRGMNLLLKRLGFLINSYMDVLLGEELFFILTAPSEEGPTVTQSDFGESDQEILLFNLKCFLYKIMGYTLFKEQKSKKNSMCISEENDLAQFLCKDQLMMKNSEIGPVQTTERFDTVPNTREDYTSSVISSVHHTRTKSRRTWEKVGKFHNEKWAVTPQELAKLKKKFCVFIQNRNNFLYEKKKKLKRDKNTPMMSPSMKQMIREEMMSPVLRKKYSDKKESKTCYPDLLIEKGRKLKENKERLVVDKERVEVESCTFKPAIIKQKPAFIECKPKTKKSVSKWEELFK